MSDAPRHEPAKAAGGDGLWPMFGGVGGFLALHYGVWRWPRVRALFANDEERFLIVVASLFIGSLWLYYKLAKLRLDRALKNLEADLDEDERRLAASGPSKLSRERGAIDA
jgi:hypothetical protein